MSNTNEETVGCVKWFNNKSGYGFITVNEGDHIGKDIFVHHSNICVIVEQYKYLVQGEYVVFRVDTTTVGKHTHQAMSVHGINGGQLMCETRRNVKENRIRHNNDNDN